MTGGPGHTPSVRPDADGRARLVGELSTSFVVGGAAGSGRTHALVQRALALVRGGAPAGAVVLCTGSEAAAAALAAGLPSQGDVPQVCNLAGLAEWLLRAEGAAAGIAVGFEVLDDAGERAAFDGALPRIVDELVLDPSAEPALLQALALGLHGDDIAAVAWSLHAGARRLDDDLLARMAAGRPPADGPPRCDPRPVLDALDRAIATADWCRHEDDLLLSHLRGRLPEARAALAAAGDDEAAVLPVLLRLPSFACTFGRSEHWDGQSAQARAACADAEAARRRALCEVAHPVVAELLWRLSRATVEEGRRRRAAGRFTRRDVLAEATRLLRGHEGARAALRARCRHLLIDEAPPGDDAAWALASTMADVVAGPGDDGPSPRPTAVMVVGPAGPGPAGPAAGWPAWPRIELTTDMRAVPGIVAFVHAVRTGLAEAPMDGADGSPVAARTAHPTGRRPGAGVQLELGLDLPAPPLGRGADPGPALELPPVVLLGGPVDGTAGEVRRTRARDVAAAVAAVVRDGWPVADGGSSGEGAGPDGGARPARWSDIAVVVPGAEALAPVEEALGAAGVPYRLADPALLWASDDVTDVLAVLAAADDPSDEPAVLGALRSSGLACGDDDLVSWRRAGGTWDPLADPPAGANGHPVAGAMAVVARLHRRRWWTEPGELVLEAMDELHSDALAFARPRPRPHRRRLQWLAGQARRHSGPGRQATLRDFLRWAALQRTVGDGECVLDDGDPGDDAVQVLRLAAAAGREFPVLVFAGVDVPAGADGPEPVPWRTDGLPEVSFGRALRSAGYDDTSERARAEARGGRERSLVDAMGRARDHLVVCVHHRRRDGVPEPGVAARLEALCRSHPLLWRRLPDPVRTPRRGGRVDVARPAGGAARGTGAPARSGPWDDVDAWAEELARFREARAATLALAAAHLATGLK